jgi:hypothetical protein
VDQEVLDAGFHAIMNDPEQYAPTLPGEIPVTLSHFPYEGDSGTEDRYLKSSWTS